MEAPTARTLVEKVQVGVQQWSYLLRYCGMAALFLVVYLLVLRPVRKQAVLAFRQLPARVPARALPGEPTQAAKEVETLPEIELPAGSPEQKKAVSLKRALVEKVKAEPAGASRLLQSWIREGHE